MNLIKKKILLDKKRYIILESGELANQSDGAVLVRMGNTLLLSTVVIGNKKKKIDFVPLTIDYREKYFAGGKIPGGFIKREGKPSEEEILTMRIVDRMIRPTLPKNLTREIQIMIFLLSYDAKVLPDSLVGLASSSALLLSGLKIEPTTQIRIARIKNKIIINPSLDQIKKSDVNLIIGGSLKSIVMIEGEANQITYKDFFYILKYSHKIIKKQIKEQIEFVKKRKKIKKIKIKKNKNIKKIKKIIIKKYLNKIFYILKKNKKKKERKIKINKILKKIKNKIKKKNKFLIKETLNFFKKKVIRYLIIKKKQRLDGRKPNKIRKINAKVNFLPGVHGSVLFTRGETQTLTTVTLGSSLDVNRIDNVVLESNEKFYLHYNFPPFSTGEVKKIMGISRREVGHGNLAKKSLINVIPENIPYTIRIVSDILSSNGSSSMATVCGGTLALMDAGIKIKNPVAGVAIGLIKRKKKIVILSDILGEEDHYGDIDFKITGTIKGITSCQMDVKKKINFFKANILKKILVESKKCILKILNKMNNILSKPRKNIKSTAPKVSLMKIPKKFIGILIGAGGKNIQEIQTNTETNIIITEKKNYGHIEIFGKNKKKVKKAIKIIKKIIFIPRKGNIYKAKIKNIKSFGLFVELSKGVEGLLHISQLYFNKFKKIQEIFKIGDIIEVKYLGKDKTGKIKLTRKN